MDISRYTGYDAQLCDNRYRIPGNFCGVKLLRIENFANKNVANCLLVVVSAPDHKSSLATRAKFLGPDDV